MIATDPRIAAVEDNLLVQFPLYAGAPGVTRWDLPGVVAYHSDVAFPLFNAIGSATFADDPGVAELADQVVDDYVGRGLPFLWWPTPSTGSAALEQALLGRGLLREEITGMYAGLTTPRAVPLPGGAALETGPEPARAMDVMVRGFGMPSELAEPLVALFSTLPAGSLHNLLVTLDGQPVAAGSVFLSGETAGLYNIVTLAETRGRGIGGALTGALMDLGLSLGATHAVLHSTDMGRPVYERLGFEAVCDMPQFVWLPGR